jgi:vacuolar iron transporter family protein
MMIWPATTDGSVRGAFATIASPEGQHRGARSGWLRAVVLGANDGIVSISSLAIGLIVAGASNRAVVTASLAALVAGAMSMAAGEYVSVSSQADVTAADLAQERLQQTMNPDGELQELAQIYEGRGVPSGLALQVATALMAHDPIGAHARDELGESHVTTARPMQAAVSSSVSFALGGFLPFLTLVLSPSRFRVSLLIVASVVSLVILGVVAATAGGSRVGRAVLRIGVGGVLAIAVTAAVGQLFGA